jgi:hypothetical protein
MGEEMKLNVDQARKLSVLEKKTLDLVREGQITSEVRDQIINQFLIDEKIVKGTTTASGQTLTISWTGDKYLYIVFDSARANLTGISTSGFAVLGQFTLSTVGQYKVYRTNLLNAGGAGSSITYILT